MKRGFYPCYFLLFLLLIPGSSQAEPRSWAYVLPGTLKDTLATRKTLSRFTVISRTGYKLDGRGRLRSGPVWPRDLLSLVDKYKISRIPLISLTGSTAGKKILRYPVARRRALNNLESLLKNKRIEGLHLDFEYLPPAYAPDFARFLRILKGRMGGRRLSAAIFPSVDFPTKWAGFHNLALIGPHLDEIVLMCYDWHRPGGIPGPVTGLNWTEKNVRRALEFLPAHKIWLGIPAYGYAWPIKGGGRGIVISARRALTLKKTALRRHKSGESLLSFSASRPHLPDLSGRRRHAKSTAKNSV